MEKNAPAVRPKADALARLKEFQKIKKECMNLWKFCNRKIDEIENEINQQ